MLQEEQAAQVLVAFVVVARAEAVEAQAASATRASFSALLRQRAESAEPAAVEAQRTTREAAQTGRPEVRRL